MIKWLEENPVGIGLVSICAVIALTALLLTVVWMLPPSSSLDSANDDVLGPGLDLPELRPVAPIEAFAEITNRPVFNESRQPIIALDEEDEEGLDDEFALDDVDAPEVELAGVIITPSLRMATLRAKGEEFSLVAFEGRPLEGNFGSWQISRIDPRAVTLSSADGEELELKLLVHKATIAAPAKAPESGPGDGKNGDSNLARQSEDQPLSRAEEIRQRIAERREELRAAAEANGEDPGKDYQQSVQSMLVNKRQNADNEQEE